MFLCSDSLVTAQDDDDDDDEKSPAAISPALSNAAAGSAALRGSVTTAATGRKMGPSSSSSPSTAGSGPGLSSPTSSNASAAAAPAAAAAGAGTGTGATGGAKGFLRGLVSKKKFRFQEQGFDLDLSYVGDRIIAMGFPSEGSEAAYRNPLPEVQAFFHKFHPGAFRVYNLCSERRYDASKFGPECGGGPGCVVYVSTPHSTAQRSAALQSATQCNAAQRAACAQRHTPFAQISPMRFGPKILLTSCCLFFFPILFIFLFFQ